MKKGWFIFLIVFLSIQIAFADIEIKPEQPVYNIGDTLRVSASLTEKSDFEGLFKLSISCSGYDLNYFITPVDSEPGFRTAINVPEITVTEKMLGTCALKAALTDTNGNAAEEKFSDSFTVAQELKVLPVNSFIRSYPGDIVLVAGVVNKASGNNVIEASAEIRLDEAEIAAEVSSGKFNATLNLPKNIKSGKHLIEINVNDARTNFGSASIELEVTAVPSYITLSANSTVLEPGSQIEITSSLYDQADDLVNSSLDLELVSPKGIKVFRKTVQGNEKIIYDFSQYAEPGIYVLAGYHGKLSAQSGINITKVREAKVRYENESIFVENIGNVQFEDSLKLVVKNYLKEYEMLKEVSVGPGEILSIDLSREVPLGAYDVMVSGNSGQMLFGGIRGAIQELADSNQFDFQSSGFLASNVTIHDNRPIYRKIGSGLSSATGFLIGSEGLLTKSPIVAPLILGAIIIVIAFHYGKKPIMKLLKRRKEDDKD